MLLQTSFTGRPVQLPGRRIRPETLRRFQAFQRKVIKAGGHPVKETMAEDYGDTYYFYALYRESGAGR